jgi:hypothetical protein
VTAGYSRKYSKMDLKKIVWCGVNYVAQSPKYINKNYYILLDLILHHHLQSSHLGSAYTDPSVSTTFQMHPGSLSLLGCSVPSAFRSEERRVGKECDYRCSSRWAA